MTNEHEQIITTADVMESDAMPKAWVVHTDPNAPQTAEQKPLPSKVTKKPVSEKSPAEWAYERLVLYIKNFEEQLDDAHEIAMGRASSGDAALRIEGMELIQHVTQLNVTLHALPKQVPDQEPNRIGFRLEADLES